MVCAFTGNRDGVDGDAEAFDITAERGDAQAAHLRRGHPLLPRGEPRARRAAGGAGVPARAHAGPGARRRARARLDPRHLRPRSPADPLGRGLMEVGLCTFSTDYSIQPARAGAPGRGARVRVALPSRAHAHPGRAGRRPTRPAASCRRSTATPSTRSSRLAVGGGGDRAAQARHRHLPRGRARPDRHGQGGGHPRPHSGGRFLFGVGAGWNREEMREPRHRSGQPLRAHARARGGDEGDLDRGRGRVPRRARGLRPDLVVAEAGARSRTRRCSWAAWATRVLDRVVALRRRVDPQRVGSARGSSAGGSPSSSAGGRRGPRADPGDAVRRPSPRRAPSSGCARRAWTAL